MAWCLHRSRERIYPRILQNNPESTFLFHTCCGLSQYSAFLRLLPQLEFFFRCADIGEITRPQRWCWAVIVSGVDVCGTACRSVMLLFSTVGLMCLITDDCSLSHSLQPGWLAGGSSEASAGKPSNHPASDSHCAKTFYLPLSSFDFSDLLYTMFATNFEL